MMAPSVTRAGTFELRIMLGAGMDTYEDVAEALAAVARDVGYGQDSGTVNDARGHTVGEWRLYES